MPDVMSIEVDEEFDPRPPSSPFGLRGPDGQLNYGMIAGIVIAIVLVVMLVIVVVKPFSSKKAPPVSSWKPKDPTKNIDFLETYPANSPMVSSIQTALNAWAKFYTTADLGGLVDSFDLAGNQYAKLVQEQPSVAQNPETGLPAIVELGPVGKVSRKDEIFTVRVVVTWTKPGEDGKKYNWDIDMKAKDQKYLLNTVRETDLKQKQPVDFCGAARIVAQLDDDKTVSSELGKFPPEQQLDVAKQVYAIRVQAWGFLEDATAGSDSAEGVTAIVDNYRGIVAAGQKATTLKQLGDADQSSDFVDSRTSVELRAKDECNADISNR